MDENEWPVHWQKLENWWKRAACVVNCNVMMVKMMCCVFIYDRMCGMNYFVFAWQRQESRRDFGWWFLLFMTREMFNWMVSMVSDFLNNSTESVMFVGSVIYNAFGTIGFHQWVGSWKGIQMKSFCSLNFSLNSSNYFTSKN